MIEQASVPEEPSKPNRIIVASIGVVGGLGLAGALFAFFELVNSSLRRPSDIAGSLGIVPIATIPFIKPGGYDLTITSAGFKQYTRPGIVLEGASVPEDVNGHRVTRAPEEGPAVVTEPVVDALAGR